tara:strand:+ start:192 stop:485 length:294 start_codon:yes stop_codon:yes gene_type:complete
MALTKTTTNDKIEVVGDFKFVQVRKATIIKEDGKELSRSFHRKVYAPGNLEDGTTNYINTDISAADPDVQAICNTVWTQAVKDAHKDWLIANPPPGS